MNLYSCGHTFTPRERPRVPKEDYSHMCPRCGKYWRSAKGTETDVQRLMQRLLPNPELEPEFIEALDRERRRQ